ncbi:hypothetical protein [Sphingomonas sp.]|uniref:hypothetical protein n=1 Tax=Sphingomonas sp. TaxID=28214 RepID=UPI0035A8CF96
MDHKEADSALADLLWWHKGFAAAHGIAAASGQGLPANDPDLEGRARRVREWISALCVGQRRTLGLDDRDRAIVITEAEFERLFDGLKFHDQEADYKIAAETAVNILQQARAEWQEAANPQPLF